MSFRDDRVWEIRGRDIQYWVYAEVYRSAHDNRTYVARIEQNGCWASPPAWVYDIKFGFRTKKAAVAWAEQQRNVVRNKIKNVRRRRKKFTA